MSEQPSKALIDLLQKVKARSLYLTKRPVEYYISTDTVTPNENAYCLVKKQGFESEIIMCKSIPDKKSFEEEVENMTKYFNAVKIIEI